MLLRPHLTPLLLLAIGCGGPDAKDDSMLPEEMMMMEEQIPPVTFARIFDDVITPNGCNNGYCHGSGAGYLSLTDRATSYQNLVGATAFNGACGPELRVAPNDPEQSLLWLKVAPGVDVCVSKMPEGTTGLSSEQAELVRQWIMAGAQE